MTSTSQLRSDIAARLHALSDDDVRFVDKLVRALARMAQEECQGVELRPEVVSALGIEARTVHVCGTCLEAVRDGECGCDAGLFTETGVA